MTTVTIPVHEVRPYDAIGWGTYVLQIERHEIPKYDRYTGEVTAEEVYTITSALAEYVDGGEMPDGTHVHDLRHDVVHHRDFLPCETLPVVRPAPVIPCVCGFNGGSE